MNIRINLNISCIILSEAYPCAYRSSKRNQGKRRKKSAPIKRPEASPHEDLYR